MLQLSRGRRVSSQWQHKWYSVSDVLATFSAHFPKYVASASEKNRLCRDWWFTFPTLLYKSCRKHTNILITIRNTAIRGRGVLSVHIVMHLIWSLQKFCTPYVKRSYLQKYLHKVWCATSNPFFPPLSVLSSSFPSSPPSFSYTPTKKIWFDNSNATYALRTAKFKSTLHPAASELSF